TVPVPEPERVTTSVLVGISANVAITVVSAAAVTVQGAVPVQPPPPLQPEKVEPVLAEAVKMTGSLTIKVLAHWLLLGLQLMPDGLLVTWPLPLPAWAM